MGDSAYARLLGGEHTMSGQFSDVDTWLMREALAEARLAEALDEVPVGAVVAADGRIIGRGHNLRELSGDATMHAEMTAIRKACAELGGWRLSGATLYVTLEPCPMCMGAAINARIARVVYAAADTRGGACGSMLDLCGVNLLNHQISAAGGLLEDEAAALIKGFFARRRGEAQQQAEQAMRPADGEAAPREQGE